jgi:hypothetical protein
MLPAQPHAPEIGNAAARAQILAALGFSCQRHASPWKRPHHWLLAEATYAVKPYLSGDRSSDMDAALKDLHPPSTVHVLASIPSTHRLLSQSM